MAFQVLWHDTDNRVMVKGLMDRSKPPAERYLSTGVTVTLTITDRQRVNVPGVAWPLALTYIAGSDGDWHTIVPAAIQVRLDNYYLGIVEAVGALGRTMRRVVPLVVKERGAE